MPATLSVQLSTDFKLRLDKQELEFYNSEEWTLETEEVLIQRMHELISALRPIGKSLHLDLSFEVNDIFNASFIITKKLKNECEIKSHKLSVREIEVLGFIMLGYTTKEIAEKLFISYETVKSHRKNILEKTGAKNTASLINYYHNTFFDK
jgi:DNA-binding CsgD family transcriptional regulator